MNLNCYFSHSPFTDPGKQAILFYYLPSALEELIEVVQGVLIHNLMVNHYHMKLSPAQRSEQHLRMPAGRAPPAG